MKDDPKLRLGRLFESEFERKAHKRRLVVIRHCDQLGVNGIKAPMATGPFKGYRLPDFTVITNHREFWVEVKYKGTSPWYGIDSGYRHGIDLPNWRDYLALCELTGRSGFLVIGEGHTGEIRIASFERLMACVQIRKEPHSTFSEGAAYWPRNRFQLWGRFDRQNGQIDFHFDFRDNLEWLPSRRAS